MGQKFHIGIILSITNDSLMSPTQPPIKGVYEILNYMTGDSVYTHQIPRVVMECRPALLAQHPELATWVDDVTCENVLARMADAEKQFGTELVVEPLGVHDHERIDPLSEMVEKIHPDKIIVVQA